MRFRKKPVEIEAIQWTGENTGAVMAFAPAGVIAYDPGYNFPHTLTIRTLGGKTTADVGDWIIRGIKDEYYPCKPDIFAGSYDEIMNEAAGMEPFPINRMGFAAKEGHGVRVERNPAAPQYDMVFNIRLSDGREYGSAMSIPTKLFQNARPMFILATVAAEMNDSLEELIQFANKEKPE